METKRINVTFPTNLLDELRWLLPPRERNRFIVEATAEALRRRKLAEALRQLREDGPAWSEEDHPELRTAADVERYTRAMREGWRAIGWNADIEND
ncbi:MAG: hypothetical protein GXP42_05940 [Chloroflexi bacterium]|nr:hypothetical protein [Chloroflexota bacterium]